MTVLPQLKELRASSPRKRRDLVTGLTIYLVVLLAVPAPMVITALGQVGGPATLVALSFFLWWCWRGLYNAEATRSSRTVRGAALGYLLVVLAAYAHSAMLPLPADERNPADSGLIRAVGSVGIVCLMCTYVPNRERLFVFVERIVQAMGILATLALIQTATGQVLVDRLWIPGLSPGLSDAVLVRGGLVRPSGTSTHPIEFAAVLAMALPLVLLVAGQVGRRRRVHIAIAVLVGIVILMTGSRTSIVCGAVAFVGMFPAWSLRTRVASLIAVTVMLAVMFVARPGLIGTIRGLFQQASGDPSVKSRTNSYAIVEEFWQRHFWLGRGLGTFLPKYWILDNQYLQLLMGAGLLGVVAALILVVSSVRTASRVAACARDHRDREMAVAARACTLSGAVSLGLFDAFSFPQAAGMFFLSVGLCGAVYRVADIPNTSLSFRFRRDAIHPAGGQAPSTLSVGHR